jgi:farnesyl-diphosphate farnesyltransferase
MTQLGDNELMVILKGVSRSFVFTIRALPKGLRRPVGLAYLLARASDTMADTASTPAQARVECLRSFAGMLAGENGDAFARVREIAPEAEAERYLIENLRRVTNALETLPPADRKEIIALMAKITRGQELDLLRFTNAAEAKALDTAAELDEYTYLVAGCVGEFWTRICGAHVARYGRLEEEELCKLGRAFGQGLQLVNILRDFPEDMSQGRCYLPMVELRAAGVGSLDELRVDLRRAGSVFEAWRLKALGYHEEGQRYIEAIRPWRIRYACLLPWALGVRTLGLIAKSSPLEQRKRVKVSRKAVAKIMRQAVWGAMSNGAVRRWGRDEGQQCA